MEAGNLKGMHVYISGDRRNPKRFEVARRVLEGLGATVWNPAGLSGSGIGKAECMRMCVRHLASGEVDVLVSLPGWEDSKDARCERSVASRCGVECWEFAEIA